MAIVVKNNKGFIAMMAAGQSGPTETVQASVAKGATALMLVKKSA
jgi:hypothetical protein